MKTIINIDRAIETVVDFIARIILTLIFISLFSCGTQRATLSTHLPYQNKVVKLKSSKVKIGRIQKVATKDICNPFEASRNKYKAFDF